jgi:CheY-like chemotaxis protein
VAKPANLKQVREEIEVDRLRRRAKLEAAGDYVSAAVRGTSGAASLVTGAIGLLDPVLLPAFLQNHSLHALGIGVSLLAGPKLLVLTKRVLDVLAKPNITTSVNYRDVAGQFARVERRSRLLMLLTGATLVTLSIAFFRTQAPIVAFLTAFLVLFGVQMILASIGVNSQLLGTIPALPDTRQRTAMEDGDIRQTISANIALALGAIKYASETGTPDSMREEMRERLGAATNVVLANAGRISFERYAELYIPFLEKSAALRTQPVDAQQAVVILQEFQQRFGFPNLEYDTRLSYRPAEHYSSAELDGLKILVLDDDPSILRIAELLLSRSGAIVVTADDVQKALAIVADDEPDLILSDLVLGRESGHDFLRRVRQVDERLPVVALSAYAPSIAQLAKEGFASFISKPLTQEQLTRTLATLPAVSKLLIRRREDQR